MREATIATHNGSEVHQAHNRREERVVEKQGHIDPDGKHEIWIDIPMRQAYHEIFDDAVKEYNAKQKKNPDRKIKDYYAKMAKDDKKHPAYEMIVGVYGQDGEPIPETECREILSEYLEDFQKRNGRNIEVIGAYYHADEEGKPHMHLDYIPVARDLKRGMSVQNSLSQALKQLGYVEQTQKNTRQMQFQRAENAALERICKEHGIKVLHPMKERAEHLDTEIYKATQRLSELELELEATRKTLNVLNRADGEKGGFMGKVVISKADYTKLVNSVSELSEQLKELGEDKERLKKQKGEYEDRNNAYRKELEDKSSLLQAAEDASREWEAVCRQNAETVGKNLAEIWAEDPQLFHAINVNRKWPRMVVESYDKEVDRLQRIKAEKTRQIPQKNVKKTKSNKKHRGNDFER